MAVVRALDYACLCHENKRLHSMASIYDDRSDHGVRASAVRSLADLPEEALRLVMECVPLIARLQSCSLVCRSMHKAAAAAAVTRSIKVPSIAAASAEHSALQLYLQKYGHQLTSISLDEENLFIPDQNRQETAEDDRQQQRLLTLLPCSKLQELVLDGGRLQPAVLHGPAATLTKLVLQSPVRLVKSPTAGQFKKRCHGWDKTPGVLLEFDWSDGSESDADSAGDPSESDDEDPPNSSQGAIAPLGQQFHEALLHLSGLKHLQLDYCSDGTQATRFGKALPYLSHLTHLKVWWYCVDFKPWRQHLSCLTDLRVLALYTDREHSHGFVRNLKQHSLSADEVLEGVQHLQCLTELRACGLCLAVTAHSSSTLGRLTGLQVLQLSYASCDLSALAAITGLRSLSLQHLQPDWDDEPDNMPEVQPVSKQQLHTTLLQLQHLTCFRMSADSRSAVEALDETWELPAAPWSHYYKPKRKACASSRGDEDKACGDAHQIILGNAAESGASSKPQPGMEVFAAFTASSCLQHLDLSSAMLQFHSWQHMFPPGRTLLQLTCLQAPYSLYYPSPADNDLALTDADVEAMVSCCPALQALDAINVLHLSDKPHLSTLQHLTRLQAMWGGCYYRAWDSNGGGKFYNVWGRVKKAAAARELSTLANLQQLKLRGGGQWGECLFEALQHLRHLTQLQLNAMYDSGEFDERLTDGEVGLIARLTGLQVLAVTDYTLQEAQLLQLASLPQLTKLFFTPAADMSTVFVEALTPFITNVASSNLPRGFCTIQSTAKDCFGHTVYDILHQLLQQLSGVYQQAETTSTDLGRTTAHQQWQLHDKDRQFERLQQELVEIKSTAEQQKREHEAATEAAAAAAVLRGQELGKAQQLMQEQQQQLEQQRLQLDQQQQEVALKQQSLDMQQLHIQQIKQQHRQQLCGQHQAARQQAQILQQQQLAVQQRVQVELAQKDVMLAQQQQQLAHLQLWAAQTHQQQ